MDDLKEKYFKPHPDSPPLILHRKELLSGNYPFKALEDSATRRHFDEDLLALLASWNYTVITVCIDKKVHREQYSVWRYEPYHYCLAVLLERYVGFLENLNRQGDAMAEGRGGKADRSLKESFNRLWKQGTGYISGERFQAVLTSRELKVKRKENNIAGLQLADIIAHPSRNELLQLIGLLREIAPFAKKIIKILHQGKYHRSPFPGEQDKVYGYGMKLLPSDFCPYLPFRWTEE